MANSTLKQIAEELGVSISTVSRAINGKNVVNGETRNRIIKLAEKYSYTPNEIARSLQKRSTQTIAIVLPDISESFFGTIVKEIDRVVSEKDYLIVLTDTHERADLEKKYLDMLYTRQVDALVLATIDINGHSVKRFLESGKPVVFIDNVPDLESIDAITIDNQMASRLAVDYLCSKGHKKIAAILGSTQETTGAERLKGFRESLEKNVGFCDERLIAFGDYKRDSGYKTMKKLLEKRKSLPFSAVFVTSEQMTYGAMTAIKESGLKVPEDISVIGFDIHNSQGIKQQRISSIRQPEETIGKLVGERILKSLGSFNIKSEHIFLEPFLEIGDTVSEI